MRKQTQLKKNLRDILSSLDLPTGNAYRVFLLEDIPFDCESIKFDADVRTVISDIATAFILQAREHQSVILKHFLKYAERAGASAKLRTSTWALYCEIFEETETVTDGPLPQDHPPPTDETCFRIHDAFGLSLNQQHVQCPHQDEGAEKPCPFSTTNLLLSAELRQLLISLDETYSVYAAILKIRDSINLLLESTIASKTNDGMMNDAYGGYNMLKRSLSGLINILQDITDQRLHYGDEKTTDLKERAEHFFEHRGGYINIGELNLLVTYLGKMWNSLTNDGDTSDMRALVRTQILKRDGPYYNTLSSVVSLIDAQLTRFEQVLHERTKQTQVKLGRSGDNMDREGVNTRMLISKFQKSIAEFPHQLIHTIWPAPENRVDLQGEGICRQ
jgi:hypothetical protein